MANVNGTHAYTWQHTTHQHIHFFCSTKSITNADAIWNENFKNVNMIPLNWWFLVLYLLVIEHRLRSIIHSPTTNLTFMRREQRERERYAINKWIFVLHVCYLHHQHQHQQPNTNSHTHNSIYLSGSWCFFLFCFWFSYFLYLYTKIVQHCSCTTTIHPIWSIHSNIDDVRSVCIITLSQAAAAAAPGK